MAMSKSEVKFQAPTLLWGTLALFVLVGVASFGFGLMKSPERVWVSFIQNQFYFMSLGLGGLFFAALQWMTGAMWSAPIRRIGESFTAYLPIALVGVIILIFGMHDLYPWTHASHVEHDEILKGKSGYLSIPFFIIRNLVAVGVWLFYAKKLIGNSLAQDTQVGNYALTLKNRSMTPVFMIVFGLTFTMASFDCIMSLDPHWFSTIFGVYCFAGLFYSTLAAICLIVLYLRAKGLLAPFVNDNHLHDIGKFMFAFTIFWAYIGFSQFMLIWYANLPEETGYYIKRFADQWMWVSIFLLVGKFVTPFIVLLPRDAKRNPKILAGVGVFMLLAQWIDVLWMVQPEFFKTGPVLGWIELGIALGFLGLFGLVVTRFLTRNNVVAIGDPRLEESVHHHHQ